MQLPAGLVLYSWPWGTALTRFSAPPEDRVHSSRFLFWLLLDLAFCWHDLVGLKRASLHCWDGAVGQGSDPCLGNEQEHLTFSFPDRLS